MNIWVSHVVPDLGSPTMKIRGLSWPFLYRQKRIRFNGRSRPALIRLRKAYALASLPTEHSLGYHWILPWWSRKCGRLAPLSGGIGTAVRLTLIYPNRNATSTTFSNPTQTRPVMRKEAPCPQNRCFTDTKIRKSEVRVHGTFRR